MSNRRIVLAGCLAALTTPVHAQGALPSVSVREAHERLSSGKAILVDIRTPEEWSETGVAAGAVKLDMTAPDFLARLEGLKRENPGKDIDLICHSAGRSADVQRALSRRGWQGLVNVRGGMAGQWLHQGWIAARLPVERK